MINMRKLLICVLIGSVVSLVFGCPEESDGATSAVDDYESLLEELPAEFDVIVPEQSIDAKTKYPDYVYVKSGEITSEAKIIPYEYVGGNVIGIGWYPYDELEKRELYSDAIFYAEPSIDAGVIAEIPKGTKLEISGKSAICNDSLVHEDRWSHYLSYEAVPESAVETAFYWRRAHYEGKVGWIKGSRLLYSGDEMGYGWCTAGFGPWGQELIYDSKMNITKITGFISYSSVGEQAESGKWSRYSEKNGYHLVAWYDIELIPRNNNDINTESGFRGEMCTPRAYDVYFKRDINLTTPEWFSNLPEDVFVADYHENDNGVWISDAANARVIFFYADRNTSIEFGDFVLPAALTCDGAGGVWIYDSVLNRLVHFNDSVQPIEMIDDIEVLSLAYNPDTDILWVCEKCRVQVDEYTMSSTRLIGFDEDGKLIAQLGEVKDISLIDMKTKGVNMIALENGSMKIYRWLISW